MFIKVVVGSWSHVINNIIVLLKSAHLTFVLLGGAGEQTVTGMIEHTRIRSMEDPTSFGKNRHLEEFSTILINICKTRQIIPGELT